MNVLFDNRIRQKMEPGYPGFMPTDGARTPLGLKG